MLKVLIVDDEPKVREGLKAIIPWESCGFTVAATASNGLEAMDKYEEIKPDLVVADIRMPGMDGLQLVKALREKDAKLRILILSGYADFTYAKKAMEHKADGYLLKPVDADEMVSYLEKIRDEYTREQEKRGWDQTTKRGARNVFVQSLLTEPWDKESSGLESRGMKSAAESLGLIWKEYQVLLIDFHAEESIGDDLGILEGAQKQVSDYFERSGKGVFFFVHSQWGVLLKFILLGEQMRKELHNEISALLKDSGVQATAILGPVVHSLDEVFASFEVARGLRKRIFFAPENSILSVENEWPVLQPGEQGKAFEHLEDRLYYAIDIGNKAVLKPMIRSAGEGLVRSGTSEAEVKRHFAELLSRLLIRLSLNRSFPGNDLKKGADRIALIYGQRNLPGLYKTIDGVLDSVMETLSLRPQGQNMKALLDFIQRNFSENLKLENLAVVFNYSTAYLGQIFKDTTGDYFNTYLDKVRIDHAKQYLQQGMKVYEVAEKVGYTNVNYFHSKFRKYVGQSPSDYRKNGDR